MQPILDPPETPVNTPREVLLVCSPGGHLMQMFALRTAWADLRRTWVTLAAADTRTLLASENHIFAHGPTNRSLKNLVRNMLLAIRVVRAKRPDAVLSTGAGLAVPFFIAGKLYGARLVYVESLTRVHGPSLSGRLVYPLSDHFFVQWPEARTRGRMRFAGRLL
jgi:UDP-N-acetylglucosamine:LPS N-acetylglucosamine transferase